MKLVDPSDDAANEGFALRNKNITDNENESIITFGVMGLVSIQDILTLRVDEPSSRRLSTAPDDGHDKASIRRGQRTHSSN